jgi:hypothetical protein
MDDAVILARLRYPAVVEFKVRRIQGQGHLWVAETSIRYNGGPWHYGCSILELRGEKVARATIYFGEGWEAPEWRAPWRARPSAGWVGWIRL